MRIILLLLTTFFFNSSFAENTAFNEELNRLEKKHEFHEALRIMNLYIKDFPNDYVIRFQIANYFFYGRKGVDVDRTRARKLYNALFQSLIDLHDKTPEILYIIGVAISNSTGDTASAFSWLRESAKKGYPPAEAEVAFRYMKGIGVQLSVEQAAQWAKKASLHNNSFGQAIYGAYLLNVEKKTKEGYALIKTSADTGNPGGLYMLFQCLYYGRGCEKNTSEALKYLEFSSYQGFPDAVSKLQILKKYNK